MYRIYKFKLHNQSHVIYNLAIHLQDEQYVYFKRGFEKNLGARLTAWFDLWEEGTGEAYFFIFQGIFFSFKYIQICTKTSPKPPLLVQY